MKSASSNSSSEDTTKAKVSFKEFIAISRWSITLLFQISPVYATFNLASSMLMGLQGLGNALIFAKIIDVLINTAASSSSKLSDLYPYLALILVFNVVEAILNFANNYSDNVLRTICFPRTRRLLYSKLQDLGIQTIEQPEVSNKIFRANDYLDNIYYFNQGIVDGTTYFMQAISALVVVISFFPLFAPLVIVASIPYLLHDQKFRRLIYSFSFTTTDESRKAQTSFFNLSRIQTLQEIYTAGAFKFLDEKYEKFQEYYNSARIKMFKGWGFGNNAYNLLTDLVVVFGYAKVFQTLILKLITVGDVTFQVRALSLFKDSMAQSLRVVSKQFEMSIQLKDTYELFQTKPVQADGKVKLIKLPAGPTIEFKNVSFQYPRSDKFVFKNLNLTINSGEKVALVGPNGVGKTTLVKLICRMYPVTEGEILINGTNVNELSAESWYQNLGVLFQDFNMYDQLTAKENILIGDTSTRPNFERVKKAAESADAKGFIEAFSNGWDQLLNPAYKGGIRPSTGQWQKLAIARFFYRNAPLCIFDEPTASIDAVSEFKIFNRIYSFFKGKTVIIVSHRFSTVRNADRIIVLKKGQIVEEGSHADLMSKTGHYKEAFDLQASGYSG